MQRDLLKDSSTTVRWSFWPERSIKTIDTVKERKSDGFLGTTILKGNSADKNGT